MRFVSFASSVVLFASVAAVGCAAQQDDGAASDEAAATERPAVQSLAELKTKSADELDQLFETDRAKALTTLPSGAYVGIPICRNERIPAARDLPPSIRKILGGPVAENQNIFGEAAEEIGSQLLVHTLKLSDGLSNGLASKIWHGKHFTPSGANEGNVKNYIDIFTSNLQVGGRLAAEAKYFVDPKYKFVVLDYAKAETGLRGLFVSGLSVDLIRHVYDTARVVNAQKGIYLGMAWLIETPGTFQPVVVDGKLKSNPGVAVPSCYFALQHCPGNCNSDRASESP